MGLGREKFQDGCCRVGATQHDFSLKEHKRSRVLAELPATFSRILSLSVRQPLLSPQCLLVPGEPGWGSRGRGSSSRPETWVWILALALLSLRDLWSLHEAL